MKRIISLLICISLLLSTVVLAQNVAFVLEPIVVRYNENAARSEDIVIKGSFDESIVLRVFDNNGNLLYVDNTDSTKDGLFEFKAFKLEKPDVEGLTPTSTTNDATRTVNKYTLDYKFVISNSSRVLFGKTDLQQGINETVQVEYSEAIIKGQVPDGPDGPSVPKEDKVPEWDGYIGGDTTDTEPSEIPAYEDPRNPYGQNEALWDRVNKVTTDSAAASIITKITKATKDEAMAGETARNNVAFAGETMFSNINAKKMRIGLGNKLTLNESSITSDDLAKLDKTMSAIEQSIQKNNITLNRNMLRELVLNVKFSNSSKATVAISKKLVEKLEGVDILTIKDADFKISYTVKELKEMLGDREEVTFTIDKSGMTGKSKKIAINFDTDKTQTVKISFPGLDGNEKYMAVVDAQGNPVGGHYNPATGALEAKISESGVYHLVENKKDFEDIKHLSEEMQESIKILAAKGIIEGTSEKEFSPEDTISRAEVAALLLRVLSKVDPNADGGFADVKKSDWFYGTAGSAKAYGMIIGFEDNTFRGKVTIAKDQILTIASRVLQKEMKYIVPEDTSEWLKFKDASSIADWAEKDIALTTMANIITRTADNTIHADENMTRGDAALIIMRLFYKIW